VAVEGSSSTGANALHLTLPTFDRFGQQSRFIDVFNHGVETFEYAASADQPWIHLSQTQGMVTKEARLFVNIDWAKASEGANEGVVTISQKGGSTISVQVQALHRPLPPRDSQQGFIEGDHYISIEAEHFTSQSSVGAVHWEKIPGFGETLSGVAVFPVTAASTEPPQPAPVLEYRMYLFEGGKFNVQAILAPTLNSVPGRGLRFTISFDDLPPLVVDALAHTSQKDWEQAVSDGVRKVTSTLSVDGPGFHTLKFRSVDAGVVLEKLVISQGELPVSYLGPPESYRSSIGNQHPGT
jgi:hypothetical protein